MDSHSASSEVSLMAWSSDAHQNRLQEYTWPSCEDWAPLRPSFFFKSLVILMHLHLRTLLYPEKTHLVVLTH